MDLETLADDLGCFPFDYGPSHPQSDSQEAIDGIRSIYDRQNLRGAKVRMPRGKKNYVLKNSGKQIFRKKSKSFKQAFTFDVVTPVFKTYTFAAVLKT